MQKLSVKKISSFNAPVTLFLNLFCYIINVLNLNFKMVINMNVKNKKLLYLNRDSFMKILKNSKKIKNTLS